ncbi:MAG: ornithine carbamoyltransferase [Bryobacteraceae bacterium]|nr:ornithine carbamoyltransferase [Bryobacteraceae bacterium]
MQVAVPVAMAPSSRIAAGDLRSDLDLTAEELDRLLELTLQVKRAPARFASALKGSYIALLFEKPSLRTRMTFELAIKQLGGDAILGNGMIGEREPLKDVARNLERWVNGIVARTFTQSTIDDLASWACVPVVNALSDRYHPCQALADVFTLQERFGRLKGLKLAFSGDGNNVAHSLMLNAARLGVDFALASPEGYDANPEVIAKARELASATGATIQCTRDPYEAVRGAHAVYTDVWASMGQENEAAQRRGVFAPYQVNESLFAASRPDSIFMHCLPAKRGEEVTDEVVELRQSAVFDQAENRLHVQKALLLMLL